MSDSLFQTVSDPKESLRLLKQAPRSQSPVTIWTRQQEVLFEAVISQFVEASNLISVLLPTRFDLSRFQLEVTKKGLREFYFTFGVSQSKLFLKTMLIGFDEGRLAFRILDKVYRVQRRQEFRIPIAENIPFKVEFTDPLHENTTLIKRVMDVSSSGLSFFANSSDEPIFPKGIELFNLRFHIKNAPIQCNGEVRYVKTVTLALSNKTGVRVGVKFNSLTKKDRDRLKEYVLEEGRKLFAEMMP